MWARAASCFDEAARAAAERHDTPAAPRPAKSAAPHRTARAV